MPRREPCALLAAVALACGLVHSQIRPEPEAIRSIRSLAVVFPDPGEFTIYHERMQGTPHVAMVAPLTLLGGIVGLVTWPIAAIGAITNHAARDERAARWLATMVESDECRPGIRSAFERTLARSGTLQVEVFKAVPDRNSLDRYDGVLVVETHRCGFRRLDKHRSELAAFVEMSAELVLSDGRKIWDARDSVLGTGEFPFPQLEASPDLVRDEFAGVLQEAGRRVANELLHP